MDRPTQGQIKEFWEWCGIRYEPDEDEFKVIFPDEQPWYNFGHNWETDEIEPDIDLNNLFRYAVPKANSLGWGIGLMPCGPVGDPLWYGDTFNIGKELHYRETNPKMDDPALALFWALWQVKERS